MRVFLDGSSTGGDEAIVSRPFECRIARHCKSTYEYRLRASEQGTEIENLLVLALASLWVLVDGLSLKVQATVVETVVPCEEAAVRLRVRTGGADSSMVAEQPGWDRKNEWLYREKPVGKRG